MAMVAKIVRKSDVSRISLCLQVLSDPDDETLKAALHQYAKERLSTEQRLARLEAEHDFVIKFVPFFSPNTPIVTFTID